MPERVDGYDWVERKVSGLSSDWRGLNQDEITMSIGQGHDSKLPQNSGRRIQAETIMEVTKCYK